MNILVLCTGNSARSILLEAILNRAGGGWISAFSAGSHPSGRVHRQALALLGAKGFETEGLRSKSWDDFAAAGAPQMDMVITVCGNAAAETCPLWPGAPLRVHWGVEDPAAALPAQQPEAFENAFRILSARAFALLALPLEKIADPALQNALTTIGAPT